MPIVPVVVEPPPRVTDVVDPWASKAPPADDANIIKLGQSDKATIAIDDNGDGALILRAGGCEIKIGSDGITINNGKGAIITLTGPTVNVNAGALEVT